jgi:DNA-binding NarL/FixJ family response regulator
LDIAVKTAMTHRAKLMDKLSIYNRSKLVQFAIRIGLIPEP